MPQDWRSLVQDPDEEEQDWTTSVRPPDPERPGLLGRAANAARDLVGAGARFGLSGAGMRATERTPQVAGAQAVKGLANIGDQAATLAENLPGQRLLGWQNPATERVADAVRGGTSTAREFADREEFQPETPGEAAIGLGARMAVETAPYVGLGRLGIGAAGAGASVGRRLTGLAAGEAAAAPLDVLQGVSLPEDETMAGAVRDMAPDTRIGRLAGKAAETPFGRAAFEVGTGTVAGSTLGALAEFGPGAARAAREFDPTGVRAAARKGIDEGVQGAGAPMRAAVDTDLPRWQQRVRPPEEPETTPVRDVASTAAPEGIEEAAQDPQLRGIGRSGGATRETVSAIARTGAGAGVGAALDDENRLRGAAVGGAVALGAPAAARRLRGAVREAPDYLQSEPVQTVLRSVGGEGDEASGGTLSRLTEAAREGGRKLYTRLIDEAAPLKDVGRKLEGTERLSDEAARAKGYRGSAMQYLHDEFRHVLQAAEGNEEGVVALAKAERALELLDAGLEKTDIPRETLEATRDQLRQVPEVAEAVDQLRGYYRSLLDRKLRNGVISEDQYKAITESGQQYIPFVREVEEGLSSGGAQFTADGRLKSGATGIRRMSDERSTSRTVDPFRQAIEDTLETERRIGKQRVTNLVSEMVDAEPETAAALGLRFVDDAAAGARGARVTPVNVGGERRWIEVTDDEVWDAFASFDPYVGNLFVRALSVPKKLLREGVTALPDFGIANAIRDNVMAGIQYPFAAREAAGGALTGAGIGAGTAEEGQRLEGAVVGGLSGLGIGSIAPHIARTLAAMGNIVGDGVWKQVQSLDPETVPGRLLSPVVGPESPVGRLAGRAREPYEEWLREGGSGFGFYPRDKKGTERLLKELRRNGVRASDVVSPRKWWDALQAFNRVFEESTRVGRFKYLKDQGEDIASAVAGSRDISLDFSRIGKHTKGLSAMVAFFNAQVQGWDKLGRLLKDPKTWGAGSAMITAPTVGLWLVNKDNPEYWDRPAWERNLFWLLPKGGDEGGFWRIPKPFEVGFVFASIPERILDYAYSSNPEGLEMGLKDIASNYGPSALLPIPTGIEPIIENITDHSLFRNRPINPHQYEDLPAEMQYDARTSYPAIGIGRLTGTSPAKVENVIRGIGGSLAGEAMEQSTRLAKRVGLDERPSQAEPGRPLIGRFETRETSWGEREMALRRRLREVEQTRAAVRQYQQNGEPEKARAYAEEHRDDLAQYEALRETASDMDQARQARRQIELSALDPEEKRRRIRQINQQMGEIASVVLARLNEREPMQIKQPAQAQEPGGWMSRVRPPQ